MKGRRVRDSYREFLEKKSRLGDPHGFEPVFMPDYLFDFQKSLVEWAIRKGRAAIFADCGLGKTVQQLVWAQNVAEMNDAMRLNRNDVFPVETRLPAWA